MNKVMALLRRPGALFGGLVCVWLILLRFYSGLFPYDPVLDVNMDRVFAPMSWEHPLGTDQVGRDVALRIIHSTSAFFFPALLACLIATVGGVLGGALSGYYGGVFSGLFRYLTALLTSFPRFILILLICSIFNSGMYLIAVLTGVVYLPQMAETVYRKVLHFRSMEFIEAAKVHGLSDWRILFYHILYLNCLPSVLKHTLYLFGYVVLIETSLSYLGGFGVQEPQPSWGNMLAQAREYIFQGEYLFVAAPASAIILTTLGLVALGDAINDWGQR